MSKNLLKIATASDEKKILMSALSDINKRIAEKNDEIKKAASNLYPNEKDVIREILYNAMKPLEEKAAEQNYKARHQRRNSLSNSLSCNREIFYPLMDDFEIISAEYNEDKTSVRFLIDTKLNKWSISGIETGTDCVWTEPIPVRRLFNENIEASLPFRQLRESALKNYEKTEEIKELI